MFISLYCRVRQFKKIIFELFLSIFIMLKLKSRQNRFSIFIINNMTLKIFFIKGFQFNKLGKILSKGQNIRKMNGLVLQI